MALPTQNDPTPRPEDAERDPAPPAPQHVREPPPESPDSGAPVRDPGSHPPATSLAARDAMHIEARRHLG